jgi:(1->4)-alpha-D-glucan 1-alpha-D-glucosylmutase
VSAATPRAWVAAYRLQLRPEFDFSAAAAVVDYLAELGISHVYCSPILEAGPGSEHGYDVVDHDRIREALGGEDGFRSLVAAARRHGMGVVLDVVPNHMAIGGSGGGNRRWWDVLEHGRASPHAEFFDIDWGSAPDGRILVPILGSHYRNVLEAGELAVRRSAGGGFEAAYYEHRLPLRPGSLVGLLRAASLRAEDPMLAILADRLSDLERSTRPGGSASDQPDAGHRSALQATAAALAQYLGDRPEAAEAVDVAMDEVSADSGRLDPVLRDQHWRLARWQLANPEIAYRRFFDVTELVALRTDLPQVFEATHRRTLDLVADGSVDGLRIDHPDGLRDPEGYLSALTEQAPGAPVWVEKILGPGEELPRSWPVEGTTGYDFLDLVSRLFVDEAGAQELADRFCEAAGLARDFHDEALTAKRLVLRTLLAADLDRVVEIASRCCRDAGWDVARIDLRDAVIELAAAVPVYRTYVRAGRAADARDRQLLDGALDHTLTTRPFLDRESVEAVVGMLRRPGTPDEVELITRFQQLCASTAAKGIEDTALYRWAPVAARCDVGCEPVLPALDADGFHDAIGRTAERWPRRMLDTSTHDTKRSEDTRARMLAISERPEEWWEAAERVRRLTDERLGEELGDAGLAHLLIQSAAGAWPIDGDRLTGYATKAAREAKRITSWLEPDEVAESRIHRWVTALVEDPAVRDAMDELVRPLVEPGRITGLAQLVLKLTCPGVAVVYQGTELWDHSLVDPDNRRPVDFDLRRKLLGEPDDDLSEAADEPGSGTLKLQVTARILRLRRSRPDDLAGDAPYEPLQPAGPAADHAVAFRRGTDVVVVVPRLVRTLADDGGWRDTSLSLPEGSWRDVLTGSSWSGEAALADLLDPVPVAVLERAS